MKIWKLCTSEFDTYYMEIATFIFGDILAIISILYYIFLKDTDTSRLYWAFALSFWSVPAITLFAKLGGGYIIEENGFYFRYRFRKNKLYYEDIKCVIISNAGDRNACVTIIGGEQDEILQYCKNPKSHVLTKWDIEHKLGASIGYYHSGNIWELFRKGSATIHNYDFLWNKREMYKMLEGFQGNYYIAASVISNFRKEFDDIIEHYGIATERIHILDDSTNGKFIRRW